MLIFLKFIATFSAALFAGAALYVNIAEHPARMTLDIRFAAGQWAPSYRRATWMQAPLALLSLVTGVASWLFGGGLGWAIACTGSRSRHSGDADFARALGEAPWRENRAQSCCDNPVSVSSAWILVVGP